MKDSFSSVENLTGAQIEAEPEASFDAIHFLFCDKQVNGKLDVLSLWMRLS